MTKEKNQKHALRVSLCVWENGKNNAWQWIELVCSRLKCLKPTKYSSIDMNQASSEASFIPVNCNNLHILCYFNFHIFFIPNEKIPRANRCSNSTHNVSSSMNYFPFSTLTLIRINMALLLQNRAIIVCINL